MDEKRIIEINGVKLEVDLRTARTVDAYKVGDRVKILVKNYGDSFTSYFGMIVGFDSFKERPTIVIAYVNPSAYSGEPLNFAFINQDTKDTEICPVVDDFIGIEKSNMIEMFDRDIAKKEQELVDMKRRKEYFLRNFGNWWKE